MEGVVCQQAHLELSNAGVLLFSMITGGSSAAPWSPNPHTNMSIKDDIETYLAKNGQCTVNELADGIDYSNGYTREKAKEMKESSRIDGAKTTRIPAVIIHGNYEVLTGDRDYLLTLVKRYAPSKHSRAKSKSVSDLQKLIREEIADDIVGGPHRWEFWK